MEMAAKKTTIFTVFLLILLFASGTCGYISSLPRCSDRMIGINVGTKYSSVGVCRNDELQIIPNELGNRITPSCVAFTDTEVLIGEAAKNQSDVNPERTICDVKSLIGRTFDDPEVQRDIGMLPYKITDKDGKPHIEVKINGEIVLFSPEQILAKLYKGMKEMAEAFVSNIIDRAVVVVPAYFNDDQTKATWEACTIAELGHTWILPEPIAAVMAYGLHEEVLEKENVLVFNLGNSTFDVSVLNIYADGETDIVATRFDTHLGGEDFDHVVMDYFIKRINGKYNTDVRQDKEALRKLQRECKRVITVLDTQFEVLVQIKSLFDGVHFVELFTKSELEMLNWRVYKKIEILMKKVLGDSNLKRSDIHKIVVVGGGTRIPSVQRLLKDNFSRKELLKGLDPDEAVARGAAIQGWVLQGSGQETNSLVMGTDMSVGIETVGGLMKTVIPRGTILPAWKSRVFTTYQDWQTTAAIKVYEGERPLSKYCREIGRINLTDIAPARRGVAEIEVSFHIEEGNTVYVTAVDSVTGNSKLITIHSIPEQSKERVNPEKLVREFTERRRLIARLVKEAKKFAEEDKKAVESIVGRMKLESYNGYNLTDKVEAEDKESLGKELTDVCGIVESDKQRVKSWEGVVRPAVVMEL